MPVEQIDIRIMAVIGALCGIVAFAVVVFFKNRKHRAERRKSTTLRMAKVASELPAPAVDEDAAVAPIVDAPVVDAPVNDKIGDDKVGDDKSEDAEIDDVDTNDDKLAADPSDEVVETQAMSLADVMAADAAPAPAVAVKDERTPAVTDIPKAADTRSLRKKKRRLPETVRLKARAVLLVDDTAVNRDIIAMFFEESGVKFDFASNGKEACEKFEEAPDKYGVILMDIQMPELDGLEAARRIRAMEADWAKQIPIVAMTADAQKDDIDKCFDAGMDDHISKPVDLETLQEKVFEFVSMGME